MINAEAFQAALSLLGNTPAAWLVVPPGLIIGLFFGSIPGLSISIAMAVFLPATMYMDFLPAILFLTAIFTGGGFGGAIPAIMLNIPGTSSSVATAFDGYPMARRGEHAQALGIGLVASVLGTLVGYLLLLFTVQSISQWVLRLGPTEMLVVAIWGVTLIAVLNDASISKGIAAGILGILISTIGYSDAGQMRGTFGSMYLLDGIPVIPALIGFFAASELFNLVGKRYIVDDSSLRVVRFRHILDGMGQAASKPFQLLRGGSMGAIIGAIPGVGASIANLAAYATAKQRSKDPESFGKGNPSGLIAAESANSSSEGGSMITLLALGLPGGAGTAVLLGAFALHNVTGGPRFIRENPDIVYALIIGNMAQAVLLMLVGVGFIFLAGYIVKLSLKLMIPIVMVLSVVGSYAITGNMVGPITVVATGIIGWLMRRYGFPVAATVVGLLVGGMAEGELVRSMQISGGNLGFVADRPITLVLLALLLLSVLPRVIGSLLKRRRATS
ncbi:tripartite tricarboxylate transporter permease [Franzmannia qiaohouensis]|uniref:Tripartite tricarboxylate transporter permease n=1 Tax=Franzmannia qiaohouensis TaxID=1329370 RepID=A0ABU1HEJ8_9GAMM|nr:tripartite tricarboxylate transporter permease [Halomonas qiaohouensis]MDR5905756.1 tripartite tricarboxylate transporter permease [Halomonas qiaohouensis]